MKQVQTENAPKAVGPYSQAVVADDFVFCSGQIGINPETGELVEGLENQTHQVLKNLLEVLKVENLDFENVVKSEIYITNMADYALVNQIYAEYFSHEVKPARVTVEVSNLPKNALIEISVTASKN